MAHLPRKLNGGKPDAIREKAKSVWSKEIGIEFQGKLQELKSSDRYGELAFYLLHTKGVLPVTKVSAGHVPYVVEISTPENIFRMSKHQLFEKAIGPPPVP